MTGCSKAVEIPRADIVDAKYREPGAYRIVVEGDEIEYLARRFSVEDSTLMVKELLPSDRRYRHEPSTTTHAVPLSEVISVSEVHGSRTPSYVFLTVVGLWAVFAIVYVAMWNQ